MTLQIKTYSEIVSSMLTKIGQRTALTNFNVGSVVRTLAEVFSEVTAELYAFGAEMLKQGFLDTASGFWLDRKAKEYGVIRKPAIKTEGRVVFSRRVARNTNIPIPSGSILTTPKDQSGMEYRFFTTEDVILPSGEISVAVPVVAETAGSAFNVGGSSISKMKTFISGVDGVTNPVDWIIAVGTDQEPDADLRRRCFLAWEELSQGGTARAYLSWALFVPGVKSAFIDDMLPRGEGTVDIYIMGEAGPPDGALLVTVQEVINRNRPITADALVRSPEVVTVDISVLVVPRAGFDPIAIEAEIRRRLSIFFGDIEDSNLSIIPLGVGKDVVVSQVIGIIMGIPGVYSVRVIQPSSDRVIAPNQFPELGNVTLTILGPSYE